MKFFKIFITLVSICTIVESSFGKNRGEGKILFQHWPGAKKFVEQLEGGHKEKCIFMKNMLLKHSDKPFVLQRISGSRKVLNCEDNYE
jgi:hypothetical protein